MEDLRPLFCRVHLYRDPLIKAHGTLCCMRTIVVLFALILLFLLGLAGVLQRDHTHTSILQFQKQVLAIQGHLEVPDAIGNLLLLGLAETVDKDRPANVLILVRGRRLRGVLAQVHQAVVYGDHPGVATCLHWQLEDTARCASSLNVHWGGRGILLLAAMRTVLLTGHLILAGLVVALCGRSRPALQWVPRVLPQEQQEWPLSANAEAQGACDLVWNRPQRPLGEKGQVLACRVEGRRDLLEALVGEANGRGLA
mmetsp:Transcript_593/g.1760  ORF Transcript_593/g.1760 Transcript_593/m.1760 type:complete len:254 (+) Transcript_593:328-1089(+)